MSNTPVAHRVANIGQMAHRPDPAIAAETFQDGKTRCACECNCGTVLSRYNPEPYCARCDKACGPFESVLTTMHLAHRVLGTGSRDAARHREKRRRLARAKAMALRAAS